MNNLKTIGVFLKDARTSKNLSLDEVATKTKINLKLLTHLEGDQLTNLPNKTYVVGFVKSYAKHLDLNEEEALLSLNYTYEQKMSASPVKSEAFIKDNEAPNELEDSAKAIFKTFYNKKVFIAIVASVILIFAVRSTISFFSNIAKEKVSFEKSEVLKPLNSTKKEIITADEVKPADEVSAQPKELPKEPVKKSEEKIIEVKEEIKEEVKEETKDDKIEAKEEKEKEKVAQNLNGKFPYINFYPVPRDLYKIVDESPQNTVAVQEGEQSVYISAIEGDTWISFKVDDEKIKRYVLKKGRGVLLKGEVVLLFMGNINATKIYLNNKLIETDSKTGVKSLVFPESSTPEYELPLFPTYKYRSYTAKEYKENMVESPN